MPELIRPEGQNPLDPYLQWDDEDEENATVTLYMIPLERCTYGIPPADGCQIMPYACRDCARNHESGTIVLSDNKSHPGFPVWYADDVEAVADSYGMDTEALITSLCAFAPEERVDGYIALVSYFGPYEFDQYPTTQPLED